MHIQLYTDGAARGNPGRGGYGVILKYGSHEKELAQGYELTTNNRMELLAVIIGLEALTKAPMQVTVYSDSKYVIDAVKLGWVFSWEKKGFAKKKNPDLWIRFLNIYRQHKVDFVWLKGHVGHIMNERCDELATSAADKGPWLPDTGFDLKAENLFE